MVSGWARPAGPWALTREGERPWSKVSLLGGSEPARDPEAPLGGSEPARDPEAPLRTQPLSLGSGVVMKASVQRQPGSELVLAKLLQQRRSETRMLQERLPGDARVLACSPCPSLGP